jgi:hypothetical protein
MMAGSCAGDIKIRGRLVDEADQPVAGAALGLLRAARCTTGLIQPSFQLFPADRFLAAPFLNQFPEFRGAREPNLFFIHPFDGQKQRDRVPIARKDDTLLLRFCDTGVERGGFHRNRFHRIELDWKHRARNRPDIFKGPTLFRL